MYNTTYDGTVVGVLYYGSLHCSSIVPQAISNRQGCEVRKLNTLKIDNKIK